MIEQKAIPVTKSFLPPLAEYEAQLSRVWQNQWLTNRGPLVLELEEKLKQYLGLQHLLIMNNGTIPIQIAVKLMAEGAEVITTPFSYVATTSSIVWERATPIFVDIDPHHLTIDENLIEAAITPKTKAILATHVFGNPCAIEAIEHIAQKHGLYVIYDAAHAFGVQYQGKSIFAYGDISTCSFHATKLFHTGEGGALFCNNSAFEHSSYYSHNFGHDGPLAYHGLGINGKVSELQAALGLAVFPYMPHIIAERKKICEQYDSLLQSSNVGKIQIRQGTEWNYSYYPILFESEEQLLRTLEALNQEYIFPRRYFYPSLNTLPYVKYQSMPVSETTVRRIICLPLYVGLEYSRVQEICQIISQSNE